MMRMSKQFNEFIKCKKIYCLLAPRLQFAGGEAARGGGMSGASDSEASFPAAPGAPFASRAGDGFRRGLTVTDVTIAAVIAAVW